MAKLYFNYSAMNAGKSTILLQASHNYVEQGMKTLLLTAAVDDRVEKGKIASRIGLGKDALVFRDSTDVFDLIYKQHSKHPINCIMIDEAQFLGKEQVWQLSRVSDELDIPVICYGLRTDFRGRLFAGSGELLAIADNLREIRTICWCGRKANMVLRINADGQPIKRGAQIVIGGGETYASVCRKHWKAETPRKMETGS